MNNTTRQQAADMIEARFLAIADRGLTFDLQREIEMGIDMAHLCGAIDLEQQRHFKERLNKAVNNDHAQWEVSNRRI